MGWWTKSGARFVLYWMMFQCLSNMFLMSGFPRVKCGYYDWVGVHELRSVVMLELL
jgi:hypothetical protein